MKKENKETLNNANNEYKKVQEEVMTSEISLDDLFDELTELPEDQHLK